MYNRVSLKKLGIERTVIMKTFMKRVIAVCLIASLAGLTFGCSSKSDTKMPEETMALEDAKQELSFSYNNGEAETDDDKPEQDATEAPTQAPTEAPTQAEPATETSFVEATDAQGETMTDAQGAVATEVVTVTVPTEAPTEAPTTEAPTKAYEASYDTCKAYWLDMTQKGDYFFNGEFLVIEFQINEDIPDGSYPVTVAKTDIASWDLETWVPTLMDGEVVVGGEAGAAKTAGDEFTLIVDSVAGKAGDTVKVAVDLQNNPGFCGFAIDIKYDAAALTIVDTYAGADFDAAVNVVQ